MGGKYVMLVDETIRHEGRTLYRVQAVKDFNDVKSGDKGGWIQTEENLSQDGLCWLYNDAKVYDDAKVEKNATLRDNVCVFGNAYIGGSVKCSENVIIKDNARVFGDVILQYFVQVYENANISDRVTVSNRAHIHGNASLSGDVYVGDNVNIYGHAMLTGFTYVEDDVVIYGDVVLGSDDIICGDAVIDSNKSFITFVVNEDDERKHVVTYSASNMMWSLDWLGSLTTEEFLKHEKTVSEHAYRLAQQYVGVVKAIYFDTKQQNV
jgi:NDP-sugar pyrophosphorylase family protein